MGTLTRSELREEVNANLGDRLANLQVNEVTSVTNRLNRALNMAQVRIARAHNFRELYVVDQDAAAPATVTYTGLPSTLKDIYSLGRITGATELVKIVYVPQRQWDQLLGGQPLRTGDVFHYTRWGTSLLEWYKVPTATFTLLRRYSKWPANFANDNAVSDLARKDDILIAFTTSWLFRSLGQLEESVGWHAEGQALLQAAVVEDQAQPDADMIPRGASAESRGSFDRVTDPFSESAGA